MWVRLLDCRARAFDWDCQFNNTELLWLLDKLYSFPSLVLVQWLRVFADIQAFLCDLVLSSCSGALVIDIFYVVIPIDPSWSRYDWWTLSGIFCWKVTTVLWTRFLSYWKMKLDDNAYQYVVHPIGTSEYPVQALTNDARRNCTKIQSSECVVLLLLEYYASRCFFGVWVGIVDDQPIEILKLG